MNFNDLFNRIVVFLYSVSTLFNIPLILTALIVLIYKWNTFVDSFFSYSPIVFFSYAGICNMHLLFAIVMLFKRKAGDIDLPAFAKVYDLSPRETEIIELILNGYSNPKIAGKLFISPHTVRNHAQRIFDKCLVRTRYELIALIRSQSIPRNKHKDPAKRLYRKRDSRI